jgi:tetratricopeptide (TPR) repeat protein
MATLLPRALAQCVVPIGLSLDPPVVFARSPCTAPVVCGAGFVVGVLFLGWRGATRDGLRRTGMALACACALPWIVLPLNLPYLEHRMYVPLAGIALVLAAAMSRRANVAARRAAISNGSGLGSERHSSAARPRHAVAGVMLGAGAVLAMVRTLEYRDATKMWERVVAQRPDSTRALCCLAVRRVEDGEPAAALPLLQRAVALWPRHVAALRNLAELNLRLLPAPGSALAALLAADKLVAIAPDNPFDRLLRSRALALAAEATAFLAWYDDAEREALHCLQIAPPKALVYRTAAAARTRQGDHARALALLDAGLAAGFMTVPLQLERIDCLRRLARNAEASAVLAQLMGNDPFDPVLLQRVGRQGDAAAAPPPR